MKKLFLKLCLFLLFQAAIFAEGFSLNLSTDAAISGALKPYLGLDINSKYSFNDDIGLGLGAKAYENLIHGESEAYVSGGPYAFFSYKYMDLGAGLFFDKTFNPLSAYFKLAWNIPIWEFNKGNLGINFGVELWGTTVTKSLLCDSNDDSS